MGLILDSSILIAGERRGQTVKQVIQRVHAAFGDVESALSVISVVELTHGIYRARADSDKLRRKAFVDELVRDMVVHPVSLAIAPACRTDRGRAGRRRQYHRLRGPGDWSNGPASWLRSRHLERETLRAHPRSQSGHPLSWLTHRS